jgi:hypothetical protein
MTSDALGHQEEDEATQATNVAALSIGRQTATDQSWFYDGQPAWCSAWLAGGKDAYASFLKILKLGAKSHFIGDSSSVHHSSDQRRQRTPSRGCVQGSIRPVAIVTVMEREKECPGNVRRLTMVLEYWAIMHD